jgi:hypothetical protein
VDEVVRVLFDPRVIRRHVVRHEVEHQLQPALLEPLSHTREPRGAAEIAMHRVVLDGEPRTGDVFLAQIRQSFLKLLAPSRIAS